MQSAAEDREEGEMDEQQQTTTFTDYYWNEDRPFLKDLRTGEKKLQAIFKVLRTQQTAESDARSVFVQNVPYWCTEADLQRHFESCGTVCEVTVMKDEHGMSKGCALVEFIELEAVKKALLLNEALLCGRQLRIKRQSRHAARGGVKKGKPNNSQKPPAPKWDPFLVDYIYQ